MTDQPAGELRNYTQAALQTAYLHKKQHLTTSQKASPTTNRKPQIQNNNTNNKQRKNQ